MAFKNKKLVIHLKKICCKAQPNIEQLNRLSVDELISFANPHTNTETLSAEKVVNEVEPAKSSSATKTRQPRKNEASVLQSTTESFQPTNVKRIQSKPNEKIPVPVKKLNI